MRGTATLADIPGARVRKDIEIGLLSPIKSGSGERLLFRWADVYVFAVVYKSKRSNH